MTHHSCRCFAHSLSIRIQLEEINVEWTERNEMKTNTTETGTMYYQRRETVRGEGERKREREERDNETMATGKEKKNEEKEKKRTRLPAKDWFAQDCSKIISFPIIVISTSLTCSICIKTCRMKYTRIQF